VYCGTGTVTRRVPGRNAEGRLLEFRYYKLRQVVYVDNLDITTVNSQETRHTLKIVNSTTFLNITQYKYTLEFSESGH